MKEHSHLKNKYTEKEIIKMLEFPVYMFVVFAGKQLKQTLFLQFLLSGKKKTITMTLYVKIQVGLYNATALIIVLIYCSERLKGIIRGKGFPTDNRYSHETETLSYQTYFCNHSKRNALSPRSRPVRNCWHLISTSHYRYIDDVFSINNPDFDKYIGHMYPPALPIKDTAKSNTSASYLDLLLSIGKNGQLRTSLYDKRDDFNFFITNNSIPEKQHPIFASLWRFYHNSSDTPGRTPLMNV